MTEIGTEAEVAVGLTARVSYLPTLAMSMTAPPAPITAATNASSQLAVSE